MPVFNEKPQRPDGFVVSTANSHRSRLSGNVATGLNLLPGTVLQDIAGELAPYTDGSQPVGVLLKAVDSAAGPIRAPYLARDAEVNASELVWFDGATPAEIATGETALAGLGIITRSAL